MQLPIDLYMPMVPLVKSGLPFLQTPAVFGGNFVPDPAWVPAPDMLPFAPLDLIAYAVDSGYGAPAHLFGAGTLTMPTEFGRFVRLRARSTRNLLKKTAAGWKRQDFVAQLDSTELGDASTILGVICARAAMERWLAKNGWTLVRFWHYSVYNAKSVGRRVVGLSASTGGQTPDFLVCARNTGNGQLAWFSLEAKGTLDVLSITSAPVWEKVRDGLQQALQIEGVFTFPGVNWYPIDAAFCSHARIDAATDVMSVLLVDPEPEANAGPFKLVEPLGVIYQLAQSVSQWHALARSPGRNTEISGGYVWQSMARGLGIGNSIYLGVAVTVYDQRDVLLAVVEAFTHLAEYVDHWLGRQTGAPDSQRWGHVFADSAIEALTEQRQEMSNNSDIIFREIQAAAQDDKLPLEQDWGQLMARLISFPIQSLRQPDEAQSVRQWVATLAPAVRGESNAQIRTMSNGLALSRR